MMDWASFMTQPVSTQSLHPAVMPHTSIKVQLLLVHFPITPCFHLWETPGRGRCPPPLRLQAGRGRSRTCASTSVVTTSREQTHRTTSPPSTSTSSLGAFHSVLQTSLSFIRIKPKPSQDSNPQPQTKLLSAWATGSDKCALFLLHFTLLNPNKLNSIKTQTHNLKTSNPGFTLLS